MKPRGHLQVHAAQADTSGSKRDECGPLYNATFDKAKGEVAHFEDAAAGLAVDVLSSSKSGYRVHVTRTSITPQSAAYATMGIGGGGGAVEEGSAAPPLLPPTSFPFGSGVTGSL